MTETRLSSELIDVGDAFEGIEAYFDRGWTDGLPVVPPTPKAVAAALEAASLAPDEILGVEPTKGAVVTAEKAAINAIMAGCRPEYMPVVAAAVTAITANEFNLHAITVSTMGAAVLLVVNGPIAKTLEINSGVSAFGPGHRANATIGRAIRLIVMNVLGTRSDDGLDKATLGHPGKYNWCVAENEDSLPWEPLHVSRGQAVNESAVTVFAGLSGIQFGDHEANTPEGILDSFAERLYPLGPGVQQIVLVICPEHAEHFARAGWKRQQVGQYLFENARKPASDWAMRGTPAGPSQERAGAQVEGDEMISALHSPEAAVPIVVGGTGGAWSMIIPTWSGGARSKAVTRTIAVSR